MTRYQQGKVIVRLAILVLLAAAAGCGTSSSAYEEKLKKDDYLKRTYPDTKPVPKATPAVKTDYYNEITAGQVVTGMNLTETRAATQTYPYGSKRNNSVSWCNDKPVNHCKPGCNQCAVVFFDEQQIHLLAGKGDNPVVEKSLARRPEDTVITFRDKPLEVVHAIFDNRIVTGMSVIDFKRLRQRPDSKTQYYCKNHRVFQSCLYDCGDCTLKIISPRNHQYHVRTVRFRGHLDFATIVDVTESVQNRRP